MLFNYAVGLSLTKEKKCTKVGKKTLLTLGIVANVSLLAYFKYTDFLIQNINMAIEGHIPLLHLALPLAISFFTFQQIAYLVESYRGETREYSFLNYANFVTFFPQLIAGPIVHHKEMMPQFANMRNKVINYKNIAAGLFIFSIGLFKKVIIADTFAVWATVGFDTAETLNFIEAWITSLSYTFQLYFDFSGYTDMAIGAALLFNIKLPINFNSPYKAHNIQDFWRRWHITLSRFLRDYIYIPLGGDRRGHFRTYTNLMATFIIGGIWHGAGWTFVFWGFLHGVALVIHRVWSQLGFKMHTLLAWIVTFNFVNLSWVFFRAKEWDDAIKVIKGMFSLNTLVLPYELKNKLEFLSHYGIEFERNWLPQTTSNMWTFVWLVTVFISTLVFQNSTQRLESFTLNYQTALLSGIAFVIGVLSLNRVSEFLYFNF